MLIDWFTVGAQALNFLVLVWLLRRFLYAPVLGAIDAREKRIAAELADAAAKQAAAQKERDEFLHKNQSLDRERAALLQAAAAEAGAERQRLLDEARKAADAVRTQRAESLRTEQRTLGQNIIRWAQKEVFAIARKALADLAAASLDERIAAVFVQRLRALTGADKEKLATALKSSTHPVPVRSAFDPSPAQQAAIQTALNETFSADIPIQFQTVPELVSGIELSAGGQKVAWSIAEYLAALEQSAAELLQKDEPLPSLKSEVKAQPTDARTEPKRAVTPEPKP
ncbi:F0F1 ATP synthase subunit B family protein [Frigoriglobus tundricola]|uniref:ATP synthase subunit b n=1 Tax=Frigoriglobus tundricola TaxID=2774151 RepID=A0A6M5YT16_9BACT|nr:F0F1 ATP synthase subunit B [Frigoriglobus tundricola]QJW97217.1 Sodium-transporting ATPase subunit F [Frigoriglobus tundricola]